LTGSAARPYGRIARRLLPALVFAITFVVFLPALGTEFLNWDDTVALLENGSFRRLGDLGAFVEQGPRPAGAPARWARAWRTRAAGDTGDLP
jgi:peptidoglycan/LPS O-acetylase OafA/YrhL